MYWLPFKILVTDRKPQAAGLPGRSEEMKLCTGHVNKDVNVCANVMHNKYE